MSLLLFLRSHDTGGGSVSLTPATVTFTARALTATPGPVTVNLTPATVTLTARVLTVSGYVTLTPAAATFTARPVTATPGPVTVTLTPATLTFTARPVTATPAGGFIALTPATLTFTAQPQTGAYGTPIPLLPGTYSFTGQAPVLLLGTDPRMEGTDRPAPAMTVIANILPDPDPATPRTFDEQHEEQANDLGSFAFSTWHVDPVTASIAPGDLVEFYDRQLCIGGGVIRADKTRKLSLSLEGKPKVEWAGVRPLGVLEETEVRPARGLGSITEDRIWGWFGVTYDDSTWIPANEIAVVGSGYWWAFYDVAVDLDDRDARWVFARRRVGDPPMDRWAPGGECLFRQTATIPAGVTEVEVEWAGDVYAELFFEGESLGTAWYGEGADHVERKRVAVAAGSQVLIAVACANDDWLEAGLKDHNPGGAIWAVWTVDPGAGNRGSVIAHSDSSAVMLEYPAARPGVTPGDVLLDCLEESQARGCVTWVAPTFTRDVDSNGSPWAEVGEIGTKCGYSLWKLVQQLVSVYIDTDLSPATNEWHAWSTGTRGRASGVVLTASTGGDPGTGNLQEHTITRTLRRANVITSFSRFGWAEHTNWTGGRRIEAPLGLGALPSPQEVDRYARAELADANVDRRQHEVGMLPVGDSETPYWAYGVGDTLTVDGDLLPVEAISWRRDREGRIHWD